MPVRFGPRVPALLRGALKLGRPVRSPVPDACRGPRPFPGAAGARAGEDILIAKGREPHVRLPPPSASTDSHNTGGA